MDNNIYNLHLALMPRKKKDTTNDAIVRPEGYDILVGFIKKFTYRDEEAKEKMWGHPEVGRVYRIIHDKNGYRLHIGRENNDAGLDGLFLGKKLKGEQDSFIFQIEIVTPDNFLDLNISREDTISVTQWLTTDNKDMWARLVMEANGGTHVINSIEDITKLRDLIEKNTPPVEEFKLVDSTVSFQAARDDSGNVSQDDVNIAKSLSHSLNVICDNEPDSFYTIVDILSYIASTYHDKYENSGMPNITKPLLVNSAVGAPMNLYAVMKYAQRYITTGHEKSYNVKDIFKIIHYALFELQRRKTNDKKANG